MPKMSLVKRLVKLKIKKKIARIFDKTFFLTRIKSTYAYVKV